MIIFVEIFAERLHGKIIQGSLAHKYQLWTKLPHTPRKYSTVPELEIIQVCHQYL